MFQKAKEAGMEQRVAHIASELAHEQNEVDKPLVRNSLLSRGELLIEKQTKRRVNLQRA